MPFCSNCGTQLPEGAKFCTECGQKLDTAPQPSREEPVQSYTPPLQTEGSDSCTPPVQPENSRAYVPPLTAPTAVQKKSDTVRIIALFAVIGLLLAAALLVLFTGILGGKADDPNLGRYEGISCVVLGVDVGAEEDWIELKTGSKATVFLMGEEYSGKWTLEGESFTLTQHGDEFTGTLKDGVLTVDFSGMAYTFAKDGAQASAVLPSPVIESTGPAPESAAPLPGAAQSPYEWWACTWYGWAVVTDAGGEYTDYIDNAIDLVAEISLNADNTGHLTIIDIYDYPICDVDLIFTPGQTEYGTMTCGEGSLWDFFAAEPDEFPISAGDWTIDPSQSMVSEFDHMICISDTIYAAEKGWFDYYIFLRPWGMNWEDVRTADTSQMLYDDMMPLNYDDWYLPQLP